MKKLLLTFLIILFSLASNVVWSADYNKGLDAYKSGDYATAVSEWTTLAIQGDSYAQNSLGKLYNAGLGVPQDDKTAVKWYKLSAEQGNAYAQSNLGEAYLRAKGVPEDIETSFKWFTLAAEQDYGYAQYALGVIHYYWVYKMKNNILAYMWLSISASHGYGYEDSVTLRDKVANEMTSAEISEAKKKRDAKTAELQKKAAEEKRIANAKKNAKESERLKNFKTVNMNCIYSLNGRNLSYSWAYDGKKLYWEGIPINIGKNNIDQGMTTNVRKLPGKDKFNIKISGMGLMEFKNDFYNKDSEIDYAGMKAFGSCY